MNMMTNRTPNLVGVVGDWHGDTGYAVNAVRELNTVGVDHVISVGDFGYWPRWNTGFIETLDTVLTELNMVLSWVDGNHEDFDALYKLPVIDGIRPITDRIAHLPRGYRWEWNGGTWLAFGGAASVDRSMRKSGSDWFVQEYITEEDVLAAIKGGHADIVIAHDVPQGCTTMDARYTRPSSWPVEDIMHSNRNQLHCREVMDAVTPNTWVHGHHHHAYTDYIGDTRIVGLAENGAPLSSNVAFFLPDGLRG